MLDRVVTWGFVLVVFGLISALVVPATYMVYWNYSSQDVYINKDVCLIATHIDRIGNDTLLIAGEYYPVDPSVPYTFTHYRNYPAVKTGLSITAKGQRWICRDIGPGGWDTDESIQGDWG